MHISRNTSGMAAGLATWTDVQARISCVVVVKGTFTVGAKGNVALADEQLPLVTADEHEGDPGATSIKRECDLAPEKPRPEVLVRAQAHAPRGRAAEQLTVEIAFGRRIKRLRVSGSRNWERSATGGRPSRPKPFHVMPIVFENAFGGSDLSATNPKHQGVCVANPLGKGYVSNPDDRQALGRALPEIEALDDPLETIRGRPRVAGFGVVGRNWVPRLRHAGTYDQRWLDHRFPFLPEDFSTAYFQAAPEDQQLTEPLDAGFTFRSLGLTDDGVFQFSLPDVSVPVCFRFDSRSVEMVARADTLLVEPDERRYQLIWRAMVPVGRKLSSLREVTVGAAPPSGPPGLRTRNGKPYFRSLGELVRWRGEGGGPMAGAS